MGVLIGYSELLLLKSGASDPLKRYVRSIMSSGERAAAIVQDLLTMARRGVQTASVINLNDVILDYLKAPEYEKLLSAHAAVTVHTDLTTDLKNILGTAVQLNKTIMNLVSNAAEAMPDGGRLTIRTNHVTLDQELHGYDDIPQGDYVLLSVSDTGGGIAAADLMHIFEPFYTKKIMGKSGTGLGLAVVWGTVKDHRGYIDVRTEEENGTTFALYFPVSGGTVAEVPDTVPMSEYQGRGEAVLVVDDVEGQRDLAAQMLKELNYQVETIGNGEDAVDYLRTNRVDLVVLDMIMDPGMDGLDTYREILEVNPGQKAIIVTGYSETERVHEALKLGIGAYVRKPYAMETLGVTVRRELDKT